MPVSPKQGGPELIFDAERRGARFMEKQEQTFIIGIDLGCRKALSTVKADNSAPLSKAGIDLGCRKALSTYYIQR